MNTKEPSPLSSKSSAGRSKWKSTQHRLAVNPLPSLRLPRALHSQAAGYAIATILQILVALFASIQPHLYSRFGLGEAAAILVTLLIALSWGRAPGIFATFLGGLAIAFFLLLPIFAVRAGDGGDILGLTLYMIIGIVVSLLASRAQRARLEAERQHQRFQDLFMQAPMPIVVLRGTEHSVEMLNRAALSHPNGQKIVGRSIVEGLSGEKRERLQQQLDEVCRTGRPLFIKEVHVVDDCRGGDVQTEHYFDITYQPTRDQQGNPDGIIIFSTEVTDEVRARQRIEMAEQQAAKHAGELEAIFEAITDPVFIFDEQNGPRHINRAARELIGVPATVATGELQQRGSLFDLYDERERPLPREEWPQAKIMAGKTLQGATAADVIMRTHDGRKLYLSITGAPVRSADGSVRSAVLVVRDVTMRRQAEQEQERLLASEQTVLNVIPVGLAIVDAQGRLRRRNAIFEQIWGTNALIVEDKSEFVEYKGWWADSGKRLASEDWGLFRALTTGEVSLNEEIDIESFDGQRRTILHAAAPIYDQARQLLGGVSAFLDITEQKRLERRTHAALTALLAMAEVVVQGPGDAGAHVLSATEASLDDTSTQRPLAQPIAQRLINLAREVLACEQIAIALVEPENGRMVPLAVAGLSQEREERWRREMATSYAQDYLDEQSIQRLLADEAVILDLAHGKPFARDYYGFGFSLALPMLKENLIFGAMILDYGLQEHNYTSQEIALARAVTRLATLVVEREQLLVERAEARANELALRDANRLKDEFIGIAGHELRTPLTTVKTSVQLALRQLKRLLQRNKQLPDDVLKTITTVQEFLNRTERQIGMQNRLVNDLLDVSRVETGRLELHPALCNMLSLVSEVVEDQRYLTPERKLYLTQPAALELLVMADADRVRQVISNYLSNALKYSDADKPVSVSVAVSGPHVLVSVRDEGPGLSESQQRHVWERFYRAPGIEVRSGSGVGLGLGLHISRMIIERQGGHVGLQSAPGQGSTFWFTLPLVE